MNKFLKRMAAVTLSAALIIPAYANAAPTCSGAYTIDAYAKNTAKLSKKNLKMTDAGKKYTIKLTTSVKKSKINWEATINAKTAESAEPCISMKISKNKKKVDITPLRDGDGTIICTVGGKKLKCSYTVMLPEKIVSRFSDFADYLQINGRGNIGNQQSVEFGQIKTSDAACTIYGYYKNSNLVSFDVTGFYNNTSDYFTVSFDLSGDGKVSNVIIHERVGTQNIYKATITSRKADAFKKGCRSVDFYTEIESGASQYLSSCESMAQKCFDESLQSINQYLTSNFSYSLQNIGFVNYK